MIAHGPAGLPRPHVTVKEPILNRTEGGDITHGVAKELVLDRTRERRCYPDTAGFTRPHVAAKELILDRTGGGDATWTRRALLDHTGQQKSLFLIAQGGGVLPGHGGPY